MATLGQEVIDRRVYGSDLSPHWLNMAEDRRGKAKAYIRFFILRVQILQLDIADRTNG